MILFVGYHQSEQRMIRSVVSGLEKLHIRCDHFKECVIPSNSEGCEEPLILPIFESFIPGTRSRYRQKIALSTPLLLKRIEAKLLDLSPSLVVWSPGSEYGLIVREKAHANGIKTLCFLPPYFEFKSIEPLRIPHIYPDEIFIVSGGAGRARLRQAGVRNEVIYETGCPFLDDFFTRPLVPIENTINSLFTLQNTRQDLPLYEKLNEYSQTREHGILNIRQHPLAISNKINPSKINENSFLKFSKNVALETDIEKAWGVVSNTSFTVFESTALGRPMVSWNGSCLPQSIYHHKAHAFHYVETRTELFNALDLIYEKRNEITPEQIRSMATGLLSKAVNGSQFTRCATDEVFSIMEQRSKDQ